MYLATAPGLSCVVWQTPGCAEEEKDGPWADVAESSASSLPTNVVLA